MAEKSKRQHKARARKDRSPLELTAFQKLFVTEYLVDLNGAAATKRAGSRAKEGNLKKIADGLLSLPKVAAAISEAKAKAERTELSSDMVIQELRKIAFANVADYRVLKEEGGWDKLTRDQLAALSEIVIEDAAGNRTKIKIPKHGALMALGKHFGIFVDRRTVEYSGKVEVKNDAREIEAKLLEIASTVSAQESSRRIH